MNLVGLIILAAFVGSLVLELTADFLNLKRLSPHMPSGFEDVYDRKQYFQSQEYFRAHTRLKWIRETIDAALFLSFWFFRGFPLIDGWIRETGWGPVMGGVAYVGVLVLGKGLLALPFDIYDTFVLEARFGFNRTTVKTFITDRIKGFVLIALFGGPVIAGVISLFEYAGPGAWWYCWLGVSAFSLIMQIIVPAWILPLFNKFTPLEDGDLKTAIFEYARQVEYPLTRLFVMDGSRRSSKSNAFFIGFGKNKRIALFDTLINRHSIPELVAVIAHEIGHFRKKHTLVRLFFHILHMGGHLYLFSFFISYPPLFEAFYMSSPSVYAGLIFFGILFSPLDLFLGIFMQILSRKNEYAADRFAVESTGNPRSLISALKKLAAHNLSNLSPHPFYVFLHYSHPSLIDRIKAIQK
jgi:STE24 endopeptidase